MHVELLSSLAAERRGDLAATMKASRAPSAPARRRGPHVRLPRICVSWTRITPAAVAGSRRGSSVIVVISATRVARPGDDGYRDKSSLVRAL